MTFKINKKTLSISIGCSKERNEKRYVYFEAKNNLDAIKQADAIAFEIRKNKK